MSYLRTSMLLTATAALLAACAPSTAGLQRAVTPAHASGEGVPGANQRPSAAPAAALNPGRAPVTANPAHVH